MAASQPISAQRIADITAAIRAKLPEITAQVAHRQVGEQLALAPRQFKQFVDGREGASFESVKAFGNIRVTFDSLSVIVQWIYEQIYKLSPVRTGAYRADHQLYADGSLMGLTLGDVIILPPGTQLVEMFNSKPYARRIEHGWSRQAPDGVYEITAAAAQQHFRGVQIQFDYVALPVNEAPLHLRHNRAHPASYRYPMIRIRAA